jgi:hypothetical protein
LIAAINGDDVLLAGFRAEEAFRSGDVFDRTPGREIRGQPEVDLVPEAAAARGERYAVGEADRVQRVLGAMRQLADGASDVVVPALRPDLVQYGGSADVHFPWGNATHGIQHIGMRRGANVVLGVLRAVALGTDVKYVPAKKVVRVSLDEFTAVLSLDEHGKTKTWLLTGWEEGKPDARGKVGTTPSDTQPDPTFSRAELGAGLDRIIA